MMRPRAERCVVSRQFDRCNVLFLLLRIGVTVINNDNSNAISISIIRTGTRNKPLPLDGAKSMFL